MDEKEKQIIEKAYEMFRNYGIKSVTMDDLSNNLGMSKKTVYQYVSDKSELVQKVMEYEYMLKAQSFESISKNKENAVEELIAVNNFINELHKSYKPSMMYDLKKYYPEIHNKFKDERRQRMYNSMVSNLKQGKAENLYRQDMDEDIIAKLHMFRYENLIGNDLFSFDEITSENFVNEVFKYHLHGILNENGLKLYNDFINISGKQLT